MKQLTNLIVSMVSLMLFFTSASIAKKQFVPIVIDDMISFASYNTSINKLKFPILTEENTYRKLLVQCEDDIAYFIVAYDGMTQGLNYWNKGLTVNTSSGNIVIEKESLVSNDGFRFDIHMIKGYVEGTEPITISAKLYSKDTNKLSWKVTQTCRGKSTSKNKLKVPTFNGNSQGKLLIQCDADTVYYIMAYDCLRPDTHTFVSVDKGVVIVDEKKHLGEVFYEKGHVKRSESSVTIKGHVYSGGKDVYEWSDWTQTCP